MVYLAGFGVRRSDLYIHTNNTNARALSKLAPEAPQRQLGPSARGAKRNRSVRLQERRRLVEERARLTRTCCDLSESQLAQPPPRTSQPNGQPCPSASRYPAVGPFQLTTEQRIAKALHVCTKRSCEHLLRALCIDADDGARGRIPREDGLIQLRVRRRWNWAKAMRGQRGVAFLGGGMPCRWEAHRVDSNRIADATLQLRRRIECEIKDVVAPIVHGEHHVEQRW